MPRAQLPEIVRVEGPNGLVASAVRLSGRDKKADKRPPKPQPWYVKAWNYYDTIGEYRYAVTWVGNLLSRATLEVWEDGKATKNTDAIAALESFFGGAEGQREMLRMLGTHLTVPGEAYIVGADAGEDPDEWEVVSASRISLISDGNWKVGKRELTNPLVIRIWRPHPQRQDESDSPSRAVLAILGEIEGMSKHLAAQIQSRLTGAGVFAIPSEITFGTVRNMHQDAATANTSGGGVDAFITEFFEVASAALSDPGDPAARVPIILQGPGEYLDKLNHITFWSDLDEKAKEIRDDAIRRLALGMDMPPEILTGTGDMNHWNSWQVEEASIKAHTEPLLQIITKDLTTSFLRPYLEGQGMSREEARSFSIHADTSKIRLRPNRSKEAIELYQSGELSAAATLRENGFDPADAMTAEERVDWLTKKVASGSTTPELVAHALRALGVDIPDSYLGQVPTEAPSPPSLLEHPTRDIPDVTNVAASAAPSVDASATVVIHRALERAGARLKSRYKSSIVPGASDVPNERLYRYANIAADMEDDLLLGAWDCIDTLGLSCTPTKMDAYVRHLFRTNEVFTPKAFTEWMEKA